jgi:hypothetical protein
MTLVYDPTAPSRNRPHELAKALGDLKGRTVGFIDNAKPNFNFLVDDLAELLVKRHGVKAVIKRAKRGASMPAPEAYIAELAGQCDLVITGSGD